MRTRSTKVAGIPPRTTLVGAYDVVHLVGHHFTAWALDAAEVTVALEDAGTQTSRPTVPWLGHWSPPLIPAT